MKKIAFWVIVLFSFGLSAAAQSYNAEKTALTKYLVRMYEHSPFEGVRVVDDYDNTYLISVLSLNSPKYNGNLSTMDRIASVKAMSQASRFFSGSKITADLIIKTHENKEGVITEEIIDRIAEKSVGYVKALECLTKFDIDSNNKIYIFMTPINDLK